MMRVFNSLVGVVFIFPTLGFASDAEWVNINCSQFGLAKIYIGLNNGSKPNYRTLSSLKDLARTRTESIDPDWITVLCEFMFDREFSYEEYDQDSKNNFILVELLTESGPHATLSTDGEYLYYNGTYSAKVDDKFLSAFNFGDTALEIQYGY